MPEREKQSAKDESEVDRGVWFRKVVGRRWGESEFRLALQSWQALPPSLWEFSDLLKSFVYFSSCKHMETLSFNECE